MPALHLHIGLRAQFESQLFVCTVCCREAGGCAGRAAAVGGTSHPGGDAARAAVRPCMRARTMLADRPRASALTSCAHERCIENHVNVGIVHSQTCWLPTCTITTWTGCSVCRCTGGVCCQVATFLDCRVWGISAQDMAFADGAAFDVTRFNSASARMARHIANVACTLQVHAGRMHASMCIALTAPPRAWSVILHSSKLAAVAQELEP